jgi:hypothetical protein
MKKLLLIILCTPILFVGGVFADQHEIIEQVKTCPEGYYEIAKEDDGDPVCKAEPTGCPYGDSIPLGPDCDKHKPAESIAEPVNQNKFIGGGK